MLVAIRDAQLKDMEWAACGSYNWIPIQEVKDYTEIYDTNVPLQIQYAWEKHVTLHITHIA